MLLSDDELNKFALAQGFHLTDHLRDFARAIEAAVLAEQAKAGPVHQWRKRGDDKWADANEEDAYARVDEHYEARTLYLHPAPAPEGMVMVPREPTHTMCQVSSEPMAAKHLYLAMIAAAEKEAGK